MNKFRISGVMAVLSGVGTLILLTAGPVIANDLHPDVPLLDAQGLSVVESGGPMSMMQSCGGNCHDTAYIMAGSDHADAGASRLGHGDLRHDWQRGPGFFGNWDPLSYDMDGLSASGDMDRSAWLQRFGARHVGGGPVGDMVDMDCLLCHANLDQAARSEALQSGEFRWANSAPLSTLGILSRMAGQWRWNATKFNADGSLQAGLLDIRKPRDENCAQCHGIASNELDRPLTIPQDTHLRHNTERTGQIISPQKLINSGLNIAGKERLNHPFDVHSERVVGCVNCHYSLNNPVYFRQREASRPAHLSFDPRRLSNADYLVRPLHQFAKGRSTIGLAATGSEHSLRRCESCHDAGQGHDWLPYKQRHFTSLACESCHVPRLYGPGLMAIDWTMLDDQARPMRHYRNVEGDPVAVDSLVEGFRPVMLPRQNAEGDFKLAPFNLISSWYWVAGNPPRPVSRQQLEQAMFVDSGYHPELLAAFDADADGHLAGLELRLDSAEKQNAVIERLQAVGLRQLSIQAESLPFSISHNVVSGQRATSDCLTCHGENSVVEIAFPMSDYMPGNVSPAVFRPKGVNVSGRVVANDDHSSNFVADIAGAGFYVIGLHGQRWVDLLGLAMLLAVVAGVSGHAVARFVSSRRRPAVHRPSRMVYMYDAYERLWHWLQASAILLLLFTGLIIHKPQFFGMFSFAYVVNVHNVLGFILLINAALALFYNLASGEIRQYLPEPRGFVARSLAQAMYYSRGIFAGKPHPLEKTRERKLNPLQQITYLAILNILLPAQVITGVLIWGLQEWPDIAEKVGGFPVLAMVHTLVAWAFAAFIVMHVYLTTAAGHTPTAAIKSMIEGWDEVEQHSAGGSSVSPKEKQDE